MQSLVFCLDISESMGYGDPSKLNQAVNVIQKTIQSLNQETSLGLVTFDTTAEILVEPKTFNHTAIRNSLERIMLRGVTCLASGLSEAINLINESGLLGEVLLLTDGRANLSLNRMSGFEGSIALEEEILKIAND
ncbi:MAG: VWA domain-containing protein [Candidatus Bathyarchaeia archaeon]